MRDTCALFQLENEKRDLTSRLALADSEIDSLHDQKDALTTQKCDLEARDLF